MRKHLAIAGTILFSLLVSDGLAADSLYKRLGGYNAIAAVTDDFMSRISKDPAFERFFAGHSQAGHRNQRQHIVNFVCEAIGGPCFYIGRDLKAAHAKLGISNELWGKFGAHFDSTLDKFSINEDRKVEIYALLGGIEGDIVETQ